MKRAAAVLAACVIAGVLIEDRFLPCGRIKCRYWTWVIIRRERSLLDGEYAAIASS